MKTLVLILCLLLSGNVFAREKKDVVEFRYDIESYEGQVAEKSGYCIIKVWTYGKKDELTDERSKRNAIHGILFKGYTATGTRSADKGKSALVPDGYDSNKEYFDRFFKSDFNQYVEISNSGAMMAGDFMKISKKEYKKGVVVIINYDGLRKRLEKDQIIKALDFLF